jgi:hypothetical protein
MPAEEASPKSSISQRKLNNIQLFIHNLQFQFNFHLFNMKILRLVWDFLKSPFTVQFAKDDHYNKALRSFFLLGFYQKFSRIQSILRFSVTFFVFGSIFAGSIQNFLNSWHSKNIPKSVVAATLLFRHAVIFSEVLSFQRKTMKIRRMIRNFYELGGSKNSECSEICAKIIKRIRRIFTALVPAIMIYNSFIIKKNKYFVPVFYRPWEATDGFSFTYFVYVLHCLVYAQGVISVELLPIISVLKLEGLVVSLCSQMKEITSGTPLENEKKLNRCIKFHVEILK